MHANAFLVSAILLCGFQLQARVTLLFVPFDDNVNLGVDAWDLRYDIPAWFSSTIDTIGGNDGLISVIPFDSVKSVIQVSGPLTKETIEAKRIARLCASFGADYLVHGRIEALKSQKRAINTDANLQVGHEIGKQTTGFGGTRVMAGLHSYEASVRILILVFDGITGKEVFSRVLDSERRDGGLNVWLPTQSQNPELDYYEMTRKPFGSKSFQRTILGSIMKIFSRQLRNDLLNIRGDLSGTHLEGMDKQYLEGKVLEQVGKDVYINLGTEDDLFAGEMLNVMKPIRPIRGENEDTLGWIETPVCAIRVKYIRSEHFSQAVLDSCFVSGCKLEPGWSVRPFDRDGDPR